MDTTFNKMLADNGIELVENKKYYLIETFKQEQMVGTIKKGQIYKFIRVDVLNRYGDGIEYSKYISTGSITAMTPISKDTAMELAKVTKPVDRSISSLTANNDDEFSNFGKNKDIEKLNPSDLVNKETVNKVVKETNRNLWHKTLRLRAFIWLLGLLALFILCTEHNLPSGTFLAFCVAPTAMLITSIFELMVLD